MPRPFTSKVWRCVLSEAEFQVVAWVLAFVVCGATTSWLVLVMQAFFHDKRIGFACAFGGATAALAMAVSETLSHALLWTMLGINLLLIGWFILRHFRRPVVYVSAAVLLISVVGALWIWWRLDAAGVFASA